MNNEKEKVLISACLLGEKCRYDGLAKEVKGIINLTKYYDLIPVCPEVSGGLKTPRTPSEIKDNKVISKTGKDVTENYLNGAYWASSICNIYHIKLAILKEDSPSCGSHFIHDGSFSGKKIPGKGMTTRKLEKQGIKVINEEGALDLLKQLESKGK